MAPTNATNARNETFATNPPPPAVEAARCDRAGGIRCLVCGCEEVRTDEVVECEPIFLAECPRCDYRWTSRAPRPHVRIVALRAPEEESQEEVATAA